MRLRNSRVRTKVAALLLSLAALWAFAAWVTLREGINLLWVSTVDGNVVQPSEPLLVELQQERRLSMVYLGSANNQGRGELESQRRRTDQVRKNFETLARSSSVELAGSDVFLERLDETFRKLSTLDGMRKAIDAKQLNRAQAIEAFRGIIDSIYHLYDAAAALDDQEFAKDTRTLIELSRARELLAAEDALLAGIVAAGRFTAGEPAELAQMIGARRFFVAKAVKELPETERPDFEKMIEGVSFTRLHGVEDLTLQGARPGSAPAVDAARWQGVTQLALAEMQERIITAGDHLVERATPIAAGVIVRLVLAGGLGLIAVIASIVLSITTARALVRQLERLQAAAWRLANEQLPGVVERIGHGEAVDVRKEAPPLQFGNDSIGQVGQAFNAVQETAIRVAVEQAQLRQSIRDILLSLARRTQSLVHRQLTHLDAMERKETDEAKLKDLFRIDHLATRMRRNAENLIVLAGATPGRAWRRAVPMVDVVRGALGEVEDYTRVAVQPVGEVSLVGRAVGDVIHLLAELIENAVSFSPPYTMVQVSGQAVANGHVIEIEDRGLGISPEDREILNARIADPPEFNPSSTARLGLYVVGKLAQRHGIKVVLKDSPYGGTTAVVLIPRELVVEDGQSAEDAPSAEEPVGGRAPVGVGAARAAAEGTGVALAGPPVPVSAPEIPDSPSGLTVPGPRVEPLAAPVSDTREEAEKTAPPRPEQPRPQPPLTPSGLPFRIPQASLALPLRTDGTPPAEEQADDEVRSPEDVRKIMGSFQTGTRRGRDEAARLLGGDSADRESSQ